MLKFFLFTTLLLDRGNTADCRMRESVECSELQKGILDTHLYFLLIFRLSRVTRVLYQLTRFTENITMFAWLSLQAALQLFLNPPLLKCPENENRAGKSCAPVICGSHIRLL